MKNHSHHAGFSCPVDPPPPEGRLSVVIPTLNEEENIAATLAPITDSPHVREVIIVDGGSRDDTVEIAESRGARVIFSGPCRGGQMAAGAAVATGEVLWFLHADTVPSPRSAPAILSAMADPRVAGGNCTIRFDGERSCARFLSWLYPHLRKLGLLYGDSGIFVRRSVYEACGGFRPFPLFEDLDLVRRVRRNGSLAHLETTVTSSSRRFEKGSFVLTFGVWSSLQLLYWCGAPPERLARLYYSNRSRHTAEKRQERTDVAQQVVEQG